MTPTDTDAATTGTDAAPTGTDAATTGTDAAPTGTDAATSDEGAQEAGVPGAIDGASAVPDAAEGAGGAAPAATGSGDAAAPSRSRSPAEAFADLTRAIGVMGADVRQIADFVRQATPNAAIGTRVARRAGERAGMEAVIEIHSKLFERIQTRSSGEEQDEVRGVLLEFRATVEDKLREFDVEVQEPVRGQTLDPRWMSAATGDAPGGPDDVPGTVSRVATCAYVRAGEDGPGVISKALVSVFDGPTGPAGGVQ